ncbi:hypothetical protein LPB140_09700 [Sphingorhabdus lutea]|uniref:DUF1499 domain-containing protein n=1 Tax=Sphingorhabdus lutea TaxID=1913578 RepID=A0A1L3JF67_9SPHN|nr:hypothetical protein LPB140_09700 [Sphingorhabdus lutea]
MFFGGVGAILWALVSAIGTGWGFWDYKKGLTGVQWSFFLALAVIVIFLFGFWYDRKKEKKKFGLLRILGAGSALGYVGWMLSIIYTGATLPAIHDITTDLADPPSFSALQIRADNLDKVPECGENANGLSPVQRWSVCHQEAYPDIRSVRIEKPVAEIMAKAERLVEDRGWELAISDPATGRVEATATSTLFRFKDDIVLRVRPTEDGTGSIIDMRSVSRVGQSDLGVNAKRIRAFLADLSGTTTTN